MTLDRIKYCGTLELVIAIVPTRERQGIIWVWAAGLYGSTSAPDDSKLGALMIPALELEGVLFSDYHRDLPMCATVLLENVCDPSHLPFTHHDTISKRSASGPVPLRLKNRPDRAGFDAVRSTDPPGSVKFKAPQLVLSETTRPDSFRDWNVVYAVPTRPGHSRILVRVVFEVGAMPEGPQKTVSEGSGQHNPAPMFNDASATHHTHTHTPHATHTPHHTHTHTHTHTPLHLSLLPTFTPLLHPKALWTALQPSSA